MLSLTWLQVTLGLGGMSNVLAMGPKRVAEEGPFCSHGATPYAFLTVHSQSWEACLVSPKIQCQHQLSIGGDKDCRQTFCQRLRYTCGPISNHESWQTDREQFFDGWLPTGARSLAPSSALLAAHPIALVVAIITRFNVTLMRLSASPANLETGFAPFQPHERWASVHVGSNGFGHPLGTSLELRDKPNNLAL